MSSNRTLSRVLCTVIVLGLGWTSMASRAHAAQSESSIDPSEGAVLWRWIGKMNGGSGSCPQPHADLGAGWATRALFSTSSIGRCPDLASFCVWEYSGSDPIPKNDPDNPNNPSKVLICLDELDGTYESTPSAAQRDPMICSVAALSDAEPDAMVLAPAGGVLSSLQWSKLEQRFFEQAGKIDLPIYPTGPPEPPEVWWTLVDTSPTTGDNPLGLSESSPHGATLALFARHLLCGSANGTYPNDCVARIRSRLALAYTSFDPYDPNQSSRSQDQGGYFGLIGELAEAIGMEVDAWSDAGAEWLVMNLSIAWDRLYGGALPVAEMPPTVEAVYRMLECTACQDKILVLGAAGNVIDLHAANDFSRPMMPAAWTQHSTPDPLPADGSCKRSAPLLYAVGGFDALRQPLANALEEGIPEFVAYGDHTVVDMGWGEETATLTGSSSSTLVVSATAAAVAYYALPELPPTEIMEKIYDAGDPTSRDADFYRFSSGSPPCPTCPTCPPCPKASYVSLCESVHSVCQGGCPVSFESSCPPRPSSLFNFSCANLRDLTSLIDDAATFPLLYSSPSPCDSVCQDDLPLYSITPAMPNPCPRRQLHGAARRPATHPQPQSNLCPSCPYARNTGTFYGEIKAASGVLVKDATLHLDCGGPGLNSYRVSFSPLWDGVTFEMGGLPPNCTSALFSYTTTQGSSTVPILIGIGPSQ